MDAADLQWIIPNHVRSESGRGGLPRLLVRTARSSAHVYLHGAHVTHFELRRDGSAPDSPAGHAAAAAPARNVLFVSKASHFTTGKAIRGGVPVIFPWFGPRDGKPAAPMHGFARTSPWSLESARLVPPEAVELVLHFESNEATRATWPHDFVLRHLIQIGRELTMRLQVENTGAETFTFEEALHTYLAVSDVQTVQLAGLVGCEYLDKTDGSRRKRETNETISFTAETDRVYLDTHAPCTLRDPGWQRAIIIEKESSGTTVAWNPWSAKAAALADLENDEWPHFVCVETANAADNRVTLARGETHTMTARISVVPG